MNILGVWKEGRIQLADRSLYPALEKIEISESEREKNEKEKAKIKTQNSLSTDLPALIIDGPHKSSCPKWKGIHNTQTSTRKAEMVVEP